MMAMENNLSDVMRFLKVAFEELPIATLKALYHEKTGKMPKGRGRADIISQLLELKWDEKSVEKVKTSIHLYRELKAPKGAHILKIEECDTKKVIHNIKEAICDEKDMIDCFEIVESDESGGKVTASYWYEYKKEVLNQRLQVKEIYDVVPIKFVVNSKKQLCFVNESDPKKFNKGKSILKQLLTKSGSKVISVGIEFKDAEIVNKIFEDLLNDLKNTFEEYRESEQDNNNTNKKQSESVRYPAFVVMEARVYVENLNKFKGIKNIHLEGIGSRERLKNESFNILEHPELKRLKKNKGRIVKVTGEIFYKKSLYKYVIGYEPRAIDKINSAYVFLRKETIQGFDLKDEVKEYNEVYNILYSKFAKYFGIEGEG